MDFTEPYCPVLRQRLLAAAQAAGEAMIDGAVYAATQGPRLESAAEINRLERDGADVVGMTGMPEAVLLARASWRCRLYAAIGVVANYAAGRGDSKHSITMDVIEQTLQHAMGRVKTVLQHFLTVNP